MKLWCSKLKVIVTAIFIPDQCDLLGFSVQFFTVADRNEPVAGAVQNIGMATYILNPLIGSKVKSQNILLEELEETFEWLFWNCNKERRVWDTSVCCRWRVWWRTAKTSSVNDDMTFTNWTARVSLHELYIAQHFSFRPFAGALPNPGSLPVPHHNYSGKNLCIPGPALMLRYCHEKIKDQPQRLIHLKM